MRLLLVLAMVLFAATAFAEENSPRIKRKPSTPAEAEQIASDLALNDSLLRKGDVVVTNRGFFAFRGSGWMGSVLISSRSRTPWPERNGNLSMMGMA
jgi:hypothetical protein